MCVCGVCVGAFVPILCLCGAGARVAALRVLVLALALWGPSAGRFSGPVLGPGSVFLMFFGDLARHTLGV